MTHTEQIYGELGLDPNDTDLKQPISDIQLQQLVVEWVPYDQVKPNRYNPNRMTAHDRALLRQSLLEDGWTQPIVTLLDGTIVDGEQRWTTAGLPLHTADIDAILSKMLQRNKEGYPISQSIVVRLVESRRRLEAIESQGETGTLASTHRRQRAGHPSGLWTTPTR